MAAGNLTRLESYPFDSNPPTTYDDYGRPVYDRAVGARMLRYTYEQFFSDGVFGKPADALQIGKADTGLAVTIQPGMFIINGSIGAVVGEPITLQLASSATQGIIKYAIMLRYDNNQAYRSLYFRVVAGEAGGGVPAPETGTPEVKEYRLGYVTVPSGSTNMSAATVTNEKGTALCPYAAPFEEIDLSEIVSDAKNQAVEAMTVLLEEFTKYKDVVDSALDDSTATYLQQQITELQESQGVDLTTEVDGKTIEYTQVGVDSKKYLRVKNDSIGKPSLNQSVFTDAAEASNTAADKVAATPSCVDNKISSMYDVYSVLNRDASTWGSMAYFDFTQPIMTNSGLTPGKDRVTFNKKQVVVVDFSFHTSTGSSLSVSMTLNGEDLSFTNTARRDSGGVAGTIFVQVDPGDYLQFNSPYKNNTIIEHLIIQGV